MAAISKKIMDRFARNLSKYQRILKSAQDRDVNESDTVSIVQDILSDIFGFEKYTEITSEYAIRGTFCDLAIKLDEKIQYLVEVKAVGISLKDNHLRQAISYGSNEGIPWIVLTNGVEWQVHRLRFEQPIDCVLVCEFDFTNLNYRRADDQEKMFLLTKRGLGKAAREAYLEKTQNVNRFIVAALTLSDPIINSIRRDLRKLSKGLKVETAEIEKLLRNEVLKRDTIEGKEADLAAGKVRRLLKQTAKPAKKTNTNPKEQSP